MELINFINKFINFHLHLALLLNMVLYYFKLYFWYQKYLELNNFNSFYIIKLFFKFHFLNVHQKICPSRNFFFQ